MSWNKYDNIREACCWLPKKIKLIEEKYKLNKKNEKKEVFRGEIYYIDLGMGNLGSEKNKLRPCLIISNQDLNEGEKVTIIPLTTKIKIIEDYEGKIVPKYKNHFILFKSEYEFLKQDSCIKPEDIRTVDKVRIKDKVGNIKEEDLEKLKNKIMYTMGYK